MQNLTYDIIQWLEIETEMAKGHEDDPIIEGRSECAFSLLKQIEHWQTLMHSEANHIDILI
tara:strand:- start:605 stop:787 length:183 start_codon:yes stop_codon:yes gene_type:complete